jgi:hypothetical protein
LANEEAGHHKHTLIKKLDKKHRSCHTYHGHCQTLDELEVIDWWNCDKCDYNFCSSCIKISKVINTLREDNFNWI